jgi:creatinine amidohydrolase
MKSRQMRDMTVAEITEYLKHNQTIILPYGLCEQHGYHLPLDTDLRNAEYASAALAEKLDCIVAPLLAYTFSGGMLPGTININPNTFSNLVCEVIESLTLQGFRNFIIIPGHGGSESMLHLKESLRIRKWLNPNLKDDLIIMLPIWDYSPTWLELFKTRDYHAADAETSLMLHWCPEVVREKIFMDEEAVAERLRDDPDSYQLRTSFTEMPQEIVQTSQREDVKIGVMGYPERAKAELGKKIEAEFLENATAALLKAFDDADKARKGGKLLEHSDNDKLKILSL